MSEPVERDDLIDLLEQLGDDDDTVVLEAARTLHRQVHAADLRWDDLLVGDDWDSGEEDDAPEPPDDDDPASDSDRPASKKTKDAETLALIEKLLAGRDRSDALRDELKEYKADIANGEFAARDHQYVRALYNRLSK